MTFQKNGLSRCRSAEFSHVKKTVWWILGEEKSVEGKNNKKSHTIHPRESALEQSGPAVTLEHDDAPRHNQIEQDDIVVGRVAQGLVTVLQVKHE